MNTDFEFRPTYVSKPDMKLFFKALDDLSVGKCLTVFYGEEGGNIWVRSAYNWKNRTNKRLTISMMNIVVMIERTK